MVATQLGVNAPNGNVGVDGPTRNAESNRFSAGIVTGFTPVFSGMQIAPAGSPVNVCQAEDTAGNVIMIRGGAVDPTNVTLTAPATSSQSICYAIVYSVDPTATTTANNGIGVPQLTAVAGTAATTGSEQIPSDSTIRAAITNGATAYICVVCTVTVPYGANSLSTANLNTTTQGNVMVNNQASTGVNPYRSNDLAFTQRDVTYLIGQPNTAYWNFFMLHATQLGKLVTVTFGATRQQADFNDPHNWYTESFLSLDKSLSPSSELHVPMVSNDVAGNVGIAMQVIGTSLNLRKFNGSDVVKVGGWVEGTVSWVIA